MHSVHNLHCQPVDCFWSRF